MPNDGLFWDHYADLDRADHPEQMLSFLREFRRLEPVREGKRASYALLEVANGGLVLDVGCGTGEDALELAATLGAEGRVVGIDRSRAAIAAAARADTPANVTFVVGDALELPFADGSFDASRADRTLQHIEPPERALREMIRVTRPGGRIAVTESTLGLRGTEVPSAERARPSPREFHPFPGRAWIGPFVPELMRRVGLKDVEHAVVRGTVEDSAIARFFDGDWSAQLKADARQGRRRLEISVLNCGGTCPPR